MKKTDAGYWFFTMDPSIPTYYPSWSKEGLPELERLQKIDSENCTDLACALPYVFPITRLVRYIITLTETFERILVVKNFIFDLSVILS